MPQAVLSGDENNYFSTTVVKSLDSLLLFLQKLDAGWFFQVNHELHNSFFDAVMPLISRAGDGGLVWIVSGFLLFVFGGRNLKKAALMMLLSLFGSFLLGEETFKNLFQRPRPFVELPGVELLVSPPHSYSFPSGHAANAFAAAIVLAKKVPLLFWPVTVFAAAMAFSRIYVGVHYPFDVITGVLIGVVCAALVLKLEGKVEAVAEKIVRRM